MKKSHLLRNVLAAALIFAVLSSGAASPAAAASSFSDVPADHWAHDTISGLVSKGIINGMGDGTFRPDSELTRAQFMKLLTGALGLDITSIPENDSIISDVSETSWAYSCITAGLTTGIIRWEELPGGSFNPSGSLDRGTAAVWMARGLKLIPYFETVYRQEEQDEAIKVCLQKGLVTGYTDGTYRPNNTLKRAEAAVITERIMLYNDHGSLPSVNNNALCLFDTTKGDLAQVSDTYTLLGVNYHIVAGSQPDLSTSTIMLIAGIDSARVIVENTDFTMPSFGAAYFADIDTSDDAVDLALVVYSGGHSYVMLYRFENGLLSQMNVDNNRIQIGFRGESAEFITSGNGSFTLITSSGEREFVKDDYNSFKEVI